MTIKRFIAIVALFAATIIALSGCVSPAGSPKSFGDIDSAISISSSDTDTPPVIEAYTPVPADFGLMITITSEQCFGSAGCNVDFIITIEYSGDTMYVGDGPYTLLYTVTGAEQPLTDNVILTPSEGGTASYSQPTHYVSTSAPGASLTAVVSQIL